MLNLDFDKELADGVEDEDRSTCNEGRENRDDDTGVICEPIPDAMRLHPLFVRDSEFRVALFPSQRLANHKAMHTIPGHDRVPHRRELKLSVSWGDFRICRLRDDIGNLTVLTEQRVESLLRKFLRSYARLGRNKLDPDKTGRVPVQVFKPRSSLDKSRCNPFEGVEPGLCGMLSELLCQSC